MDWHSTELAELWWSWQEDRDLAVQKAEELDITLNELRSHMENHRPLQPPRPGIWRASAYNEISLSKRHKSILSLLRYGSPLSSEDIALFLLGSNKSAKMQAARALRELLAKQMVYRLFIEHLPGGGPRPTQPPALFLLGKSSRAVLPGKLRKKHDWFESVDDFSSWQEPYKSWQKNSRAAHIFASASDLKLLPGGLVKGKKIRFHDPLLGKTQIEPESYLRIMYQNTPFFIFIFRDKPLEDPQKSIDRAVRFAALQRSGLVRGTSVALLTVDKTKRGKELLQLGEQTTFAEQSLVLVAPWSEIEKGNPIWRSLYHNQSGALQDFLLWLGKKSSTQQREDKIEE